MSYLRYSPDVEEIAPDEPKLFQDIADTFAEMGRAVAANEGRAVRTSHAKATALVQGTLIIDPGLPLELAQGLAAASGRYDATIRFAQGPGELLPDRISTHRGMAVKVIGLSGESIAESDEPGAQDFVFEAHGKAFINSTATTFLTNLRAGVAHAPAMSEGVKTVVSKVASGTEAALEAVGLESKTLGFFGHPPLHPLAEAYFSQVPMRWGDYVGKVGFFPTAATCDSIAELEIDNGADFNAFREAMIDHFSRAGAEFELRVQLATDRETTPIEDAATAWPEDDNPYRMVGRLTIAPQQAWSPEQEARSEALSFRPSHSLEAHRPLGQVMRARLFVYGKLVALRHRLNADPTASTQSATRDPQWQEM